MSEKIRGCVSRESYMPLSRIGVLWECSMMNYFIVYVWKWKSELTGKGDDWDRSVLSILPHRVSSLLLENYAL